jgi:hypothetical protein
MLDRNRPIAAHPPATAGGTDRVQQQFEKFFVNYLAVLVSINR